MKIHRRGWNIRPHSGVHHVTWPYRNSQHGLWFIAISSASHWHDKNGSEPKDAFSDGRMDRDTWERRKTRVRTGILAIWSLQVAPPPIDPYILNKKESLVFELSHIGKSSGNLLVITLSLPAIFIDAKFRFTYKKKNLFLKIFAWFSIVRLIGAKWSLCFGTQVPGQWIERFILIG